MAKKQRQTYSERIDLIEKSREAALAAVQIFNNPLATFKSESFIVLFMIAWTYLLHAYYRSKNVDYRYFDLMRRRKVFHENPDGSLRHWDLTKCLSEASCPLDLNTKNNLLFLIGLRNQIEHRKASSLDSYLSARYQACALNYNFYLKKLHGDKYSLDTMLALSLQFAELDYEQSKILTDKDALIPKEIKSYIAGFDDKLSEENKLSERFAYRLLFTKISAKREGQADRVIEFLDPTSPLASDIKKEYWLSVDKEKKKFQAKDLVVIAKQAGFSDFSTSKHTKIWKKFDAKNLSKGYGVSLGGLWFWYDNWKEKVLAYLKENK
jgi:hypothetical protein